MTYTRAIGVVFGAIIDRIVRWLALSRIHPDVLTFIGLVINIWAAWLLSQGSFRWAAVVVIGAGLFDMVDGRVARATSQVTRFGGFFDSVVDRYSDLALYMGLLVYYASINRFFYIVLTAVVMTGSVMVSYTRARAENTIPEMQSRLPGTARAHCPDHHRCAVRPHGRGAVGHRGALQPHRDSPHDLHLEGGHAPGRRPIARRARSPNPVTDTRIDAAHALLRRRWDTPEPRGGPQEARLHDVL